jgi:hypothetical protein
MARYRLPTKLAAYWATTDPANAAAPTQAEIGGAVDLIGSSSGEAVGELSGWAAQPNVVDTPDFTTNVVGNVAGDVTLPQSSMAFYSDDAAVVIYSALVPDTTGNVILGYEGSAAGKESQVFPARILSRERRADRGSAAMFDVAFTISPPTIGSFAA